MHQPLTRRNFPFVTALLLLLNVVIFTLLQSRDGATLAAAEKYYYGSGLARIEAPVADRYYAEHPSQALDDAIARVRPELRDRLRVAWQFEDQAFRDHLRRGELFDDPAMQTQWLQLANEFERLRAALVTQRYALRAGHETPTTMVTAMFLHGGFDHLIGNMLFLVALGLLVEGAVGGVLFASIYLLGGVAANGLWLAFNNSGMLIGASGAVAALMGAFCVLWGRRSVRFFYWIGFVFNYAKAPALALLPVWLGWELLQWKLSSIGSVAYEAHVGGICAGAALALAARKLAWQRDAFFETPMADARLPDEASVKRLIGQLRLVEAEELLDRLEAQQPGRWSVAILRYRCARLAGNNEDIKRCAANALEIPVRSTDQIREQWALLQEMLRADDSVSTAVLLDLLQRMIAMEEYGSAIALARQIKVDEVSRESLPQFLFALSLRLDECGRKDESVELLNLIRVKHAGSIQADKAAFLLREFH